MSLTDWGRGLTMKENRLGPMGRNIPAEVGGMSVEYQVQMVYRQEDVAALVKVLEFRRRPEKNLRLARKIGYPIFGLLLLGVGASIIAGIVTTGAFAPITIVTLVLSALCILGGIALLRRSDSRGMARRSWARYPNKGMTLTYTFYKDHFEETDAASGQHTFPYISIKSANEDAPLYRDQRGAHAVQGELCAGGPRHLCRLSAQESGGDHGPGGVKDAWSGGKRRRIG